MWETGRKAVLDVPPGVSLDGLLVTFARASCRDGLTVRPVADACGHMECEVPSQLLDEAGAVCAVVSVDGQVVGQARAYVRARARPSDYVSAPTETVTLESVTKELRERIDSAVSELSQQVGARIDEVDGKVEALGDKVEEVAGAEPEAMTDAEVDALFGD